MRVPDKSYRGYVKHLVTIVLKLPVSDKMRSSFLQQVKDYLDAADPVQGAPQLNAPWTPGNARAGYQTDVPGLVSEILSQYALWTIYGDDAITVAQDYHTQVELAIDAFLKWPLTAETNWQSKTIRFDGNKVFIESSWAKGSAELVTLTDIDDREVFVVPMSVIGDNAGKWMLHADLKRASIHYFNLHGIY